MKYKKEQNHQDWSVEFYSKEDLSEFLVENIDMFDCKKYVVEKL
jgi:hypothetical protein